MKIKLAGSYYVDFTDFAYEQSLDSLASTFSFACRFDKEQRSLFRPLSFPKVEFFDDNEKLFFTGTAVDHGFTSNSSANLVQLSGYSLAGVLEDCSIPRSAYPLEHNNMNLQEIIRKVIQPFNLQLVVSSEISNEASKNYSKSAASPEDSIKEYISKLASQRNLILSHDERGRIVLFRPNAKQKPVHNFNTENTVSITFNISGQSLHSEITSLRQPKAKKEKKKKKDAEAGEDALGYPLDLKQSDDPDNPKPEKKKKPKEKPQYFDTHENPLVLAFRPAVKVLTEGEDFDTKQASKNQFADELKNIKIDIMLNSWLDLKPGDIIQVQDEETYLSKPVNLMIMSVNKSENPAGREMSIAAVLPEAFTGETPKDIFA